MSPSAVRVKRQLDQAFYSPKALAAELAVSERTIRQMLADGKIASYKVGGQRRISADDVARYLAGNRTEAA